jgi:hypothetical protein
VRDESGSYTILEADLATFSSSDRGNVNMSSQKKIPVDQESSAGDPIGGGGYPGNCRTLTSKKGSLQFLRLAYSFAKTP